MKGLLSHNAKHLVLACVVATMVMLCVAPAFAQGGGGAYGNVQSTCQMIRQQVESSDLDGAWLTEYIVTCTKTVVLQAFREFLYQFYTIVHVIITAALTLAVVLFGVMLMTGVIEKSARDSFVGLFKFACVLFFVRPDTVDQIFNMGMDAMDGLTDIVFQFGKGSGSSGRCFDNATIWDRVDCMLDVLIGIVKGGGAGGGASDVQGISRGTMHFWMSSIAGSGIGALVGVLGFYTAYQVLMATIKSIHTYLAAIIALAFVLMLAPMFVPMIMFKASRTYFDKWQRIATSFVLQPVILFAFLSLMMIALEDMLIGQNNPGSYYKVACGTQCLQRDGFISKVLTEGGGIQTGGNFAGDSSRFNLANTAKTSGLRTGSAGSVPYLRGPDPKGGRGGASAMVRTGDRFDKIDYTKEASLSGAGDETKQQEKQALVAVALALTAFVFISMLNYIPNLATDLAGGLYEVPNLFKEMGSQLPGGEQMSNALKGVSSRVNAQFSSGIDSIRKSAESMVGRR